MEAFSEQAKAIFPQSTVVYPDTYNAACERLQAYSRTLKDVLPIAERWALSVLACWRAHATCPEPHSSWALRLLETTFASALVELHKLDTATDFPTIHPETWKRRPRLAILRRLPPVEQAILREIIQQEEKARREYHAKQQPWGDPESF